MCRRSRSKARYLGGGSILRITFRSLAFPTLPLCLEAKHDLFSKCDAIPRVIDSSVVDVSSLADVSLRVWVEVDGVYKGVPCRRRRVLEEVYLG